MPAAVLLTLDGSPWVTGIQAGGVVMATLGCTIFGATMAVRAISKRGGLSPQDSQMVQPAARRRFSPAEYDAAQQVQQAEWQETPQPLYEQEPQEAIKSNGTAKE